MKYLPVLLLLLVAACGSSKPAPEPEPEPANAAKPPALRTLSDEAAPWDSVRGKDKRTLVVFSTLW